MSSVKKADWPAWQAKTERKNANLTLTRGMVVCDLWDNKGVVVQITEGGDIENHGTITVWLTSKLDYGADNCEHYPFFGWQCLLRVLEDHLGNPL